MRRLACLLGLALTGCAPASSHTALCGVDARGLVCSRWQESGFAPASIWAAASQLPPALQSVLPHVGYVAPDLDGDGLADACLRGAGTLTCMVRDRALPRFLAPVATELAADADLELGDLDGDGRADFCSSRAGRISCQLGLGDGGFAPPQWADTTGVPPGDSALLLGDLDGDHHDDLCVWTKMGVFCGGLPALSLVQMSADFGGWSRAVVEETLVLADVDGDGREDLCGRAASGLVCALSESHRFAPARPWSAPWSVTDGVLDDSVPQRFADLDGDHRADTCSVVDGSLRCALSSGRDFALAASFSRDDLLGPIPATRSAATLTLIDLDENGGVDACLRDATAVRCVRSRATGFQSAPIESPVDLPSASEGSALVEPRRLPPPEPPARLNPVAVENLRPGTPDWWISLPNQAPPHVVEGFTDNLSYRPGELVKVAISVERDRDRVGWRLFRAGYYGGVGAREVAAGSLVGKRQPLPPAATWDLPARARWKWSLSIPLPRSLISGVYVLRLDNQRAGTSYFTTFVVRQDERAADLIMQRADFTDAAYNNWDGEKSESSWYFGHTAWISFDRPLQNPMLQGVIFDLSAGFFTYEYSMVRFLEREGYDVKYVSQLDVHRSAQSLANGKAFLSVGHDEYWSEDERDHVEAARNQGMHLAFFSGDAVDTVIHFADPRSFTPDVAGTRKKDEWANKPVTPSGAPHDNPNDTLTGTHYLGWCGQEPVGCGNRGMLKLTRGGDYQLQPIAHPLFRHLPDELPALPHVAGYEYETADGGPPLPFTLAVLADAPLLQLSGGVPMMVAYQTASGARVFNAGSIVWSHGLDSWAGRTAFRSDVSNGASCRDHALKDDRCFDHTSAAVQQLTTTVLGDFGAIPATPTRALVSDAPCDWNQPAARCLR